MKFDFFKNKKSKKHNELISFDYISNSDLPEIYRGIDVYESESDRFCYFNEDYFIGENYEQCFNKKAKKKRKVIPPPKTPPLFFWGIFCGAMSILIISGGIAFLSLFSKFGGIYTSVSIPDLTSLSEYEAIALIKDHYDCFDYSIVYKENPSFGNGKVISQLPKPSTSRKLYGINGRITIKLTVNKSSEPITLPDLINQNTRDVVLKLKNEGINVELSEEYSDTVKIGKVIASSHKEGSSVYKNDTVYITASLGKKTVLVTVPSLIGVSESAAISCLKKNRLAVNKVIYKSSPLPLGTVLEQSIEEGNSVKEGSKITISVSCGNAQGQ